MKLAIAVIASPGKEYEAMKELWIANVQTVNKNFPHIQLSAFFLYGKGKGEGHLQISDLSYSVLDLNNGCYDFVVNELSENLRNIITKTLVFTKYLLTDFPSRPEFILRTNLSTLFDIPKFISFLSNMSHSSSTKLLFGGTFVHGFLETCTWFSGTNLTFSYETANILYQYSSLINAVPSLDDVALSIFLVNQLSYKIAFFNIPRIDFVENVSLKYTSLATDLNEVFCFRFKTKDRNNDTNTMKTLYHSNFDKEFVRNEIRFRQKFSFTPNEKNELFSKPFFFKISGNEP